ncbi:MAG: DUF2027 domain-containing protein [Bacteroidales bacterium]|nr:DUF2027 domain-containing protein [Bacteroidales bacterium]
MKFKVGDQVKFLNDSGGGIISEIVDQTLVKVRIEDGFDIPVLASELIRDGTTETDLKESSLKTVFPDQKTKEAADGDIESILPENLPGNTVKNVLLGFVPVDGDHTGMTDIALYLINDDEYAVGYLIGYQENISWNFLRTGFLEPNTKMHIETFSQSRISKVKTMHIQLLFIAKGKYKIQSPVEKFVGIDNIRFYKENTFKENSYFNEKALIIKVTEIINGDYDYLSEEAIEQAVAEKGPVEEKKPARPSGADEIMEVDLHIQEIVDDYSGLSPGEIINLQMNKFYTALENGMTSKVRKIVFIHGVGNGKLKYELIKALNERYPYLAYQDASFREYGYGATMVYL